MEYLKKKKMTSELYQKMERGVELVKEGNTAYHTEYNQLFPHFKRFTDDQICKLQHVDTLPEVIKSRYRWTRPLVLVSSDLCSTRCYGVARSTKLRYPNHKKLVNSEPN